MDRVDGIPHVVRDGQSLAADRVALMPRLIRDAQSLAADSGRFDASLDTGCAVSSSGQWSL